ncbi:MULTISPECIES: class I SAM-dependent methyltransferase [unclassified Streptomyces]|uniref:class I SAM-dependent DNA methyltransferase n=1 Tax=unclassified Streptomyces TaxID=2593676 RepID=UPI00278BC0BB|nr:MULTISPECIES: class I SAM-dependent methyltransferase [unclassified Streptomyces]
MSESQDRIKRAHRLDGIADRIDSYYGDWAASYDEDLRVTDYRGPTELGELYGAMADDYPAAIGAGSVVLDAGCGTGLVGAVLKRRGVTVIDGFDLSESMVTEARKTGIYRTLTGGVDMNRGLVEFPDHTYDVTVSCGVFTLGHVPPTGIQGMLRVTKPGGLVLLSTFSKYLEGSDFVEYVQRQADDGALKVVERRRDVPYTAEGPADYWAFEVLR